MRTAALLLVALVVGASLCVPRGAAAQACFPITLSDCRVKVRFRKLPDGVDRFRMKCKKVALDPATNGIDPVGEPVTVDLDSAGGPCFSQTLPPGTIVRRVLRWRFKSDLHAAGIRTFGLRGSKVDPNQFSLGVKSKAADLQCLSGLPILGLTIGDDCGTVTCRQLNRRVFECP